MDAIEARGAGARVAVHAVSAVGTVLARIAGAFVDVLLTEGTLEARQAVAEGRVDPVSAGTPVMTWVGSAVINVTLAVASRVAGLAEAAVAAIGVLAGGAVAARAFHTLINVNFTGLTLPTRGTDTGKALIVLRLLAYPTVFAGAGGTWGQHHLTCGSCIGQGTVAFVPGDIINAGPLVQAGVGSTFVNVGLAVRTAEAFSAGAYVATGHVFAGATVDTRVGLTFIVIDVTVCPTPPRGTVTSVSIEAIPASSMDAGVTVAFVDLRQACRVMVALGAAASEARDAILTGAPVVAGAARTFVNVDITHAPCVARLARTLVAIDLVQTRARVTGVARTVIQIDLTVGSCGPLEA